MRVPFVKMQGAGNDFVAIDQREPTLGEPSPAWLKRVCDRRRGIGADGVLLLERDPEHDFAMRYFNSDGYPAEFCGNGARCIARMALDLGLGKDGAVRFRTAVGVKRARRLPDARIELAFGHIDRAEASITLTACGRTFVGRTVRAGVPHFVTAVEGLAEAPLAEWGATLRRHAVFGAAGANIDLVAPGEGVLAMRTFERGVEGETLACGSGAMASALWWAAEGATSPVSVKTAGGDTLRVGFTPEDAGWDVTLTGPAEVAYVGVWDGSVTG